MKHPKSYDTTPEVSRRMSRVRLKRGQAETLLAKALWKAGYRYRLNDKRLPGSPDIAIARYRVAVFVDGEFWHGYDWARRKERLKSNREYWIEKIQENIARDRRCDLLLQQAGWSPSHFWEKEVKKDLAGCLAAIEDLILEGIVGRSALEDPPLPPDPPADA